MEVTTKVALAVSLGISRSSLYYKKKLPEKDEQLKAQIEEVWEEFPEYGHIRLGLALGVGKNRVKRVMHFFGMKTPRRRAAKPKKPGDLGKPASPYPNLIKELCPIAPGVVWAADFTYIPFQGRFLYLATVLDVFTREIVGFHILSVHTAALIKGAFEDALAKSIRIPLYHHSDQGSEYEGLNHLVRVEGLGITVSMSKKGSPWENGYQESYYSQFKLELGDPNRFETEGELIEEIYRLIHRYNTKRIHRSLKMPPLSFAQKFYQKTALQSSDRVC